MRRWPKKRQQREMAWQRRGAPGLASHQPSDPGPKREPRPGQGQEANPRDMMLAIETRLEGRSDYSL